MGLVLEIEWFVIQWASLYYVDRDKEEYYWLCEVSFLKTAS